MRTWPSLLQRGVPSGPLVGKVLLGVVLVAALTFSARDGVPADGYAWPAQKVFQVRADMREQPVFGLTLPAMQNLAAAASASGALVSSQALVPTAPPVQLLIPNLDVHRAVEGVGVNAYGFMKLPVNSWNAGWFTGGPVPGAPGDAVIEGHAGYPDKPMIFGKLATLRPGDQIVVVLSDGSRRLFLVHSMSTIPVGYAPPGLGEPYGAPRLTLITCNGHFDKSSYSYSSRLVLEATYAGEI